MLLQVAVYASWIVATLSQVALLALMTKRRIYRQLPWFYVYTVYYVVTSLVNLRLDSYRDSNNMPFYVGWSTSLFLGTLIDLNLVRELYDKLFGKHESLSGLSTTVFSWSVGVLLAFCLLAAYYSPGNNRIRSMAALFVIQRSAATLICGMCLSLLALTRWAGFSWRNRLVGIALGFAVYNTVFAAASSIRATEWGAAFSGAFDVSNNLAYLVAVTIWAVYVNRQKTVEVRVESSEAETALLQRWNTSLEAIIQTK